MERDAASGGEILCSPLLRYGKHWGLIGSWGCGRRRVCAGRWKERVGRGHLLADPRRNNNVLWEEDGDGCQDGEISERHLRSCRGVVARTEDVRG